jgi:hypothetical protein
MKTKRDWSKEEAEERLKPLSDKHQRIYYVYVCKVDGVPKYVGMGKGGRWKHCVSGKSSCSELNRDYHAGKELLVEKVKEGLLQEEAEFLEVRIIDSYPDLYNKTRIRPIQQIPNLARMKYAKIISSGAKDGKLVKFVCDLSPTIYTEAYNNLVKALDECGLDLYLVKYDGLDKPALVLDKAEVKASDIYALGCENYPNCDAVGCH